MLQVQTRPRSARRLAYAGLLRGVPSRMQTARAFSTDAHEVNDENSEQHSSTVRSMSGNGENHVPTSWSEYMGGNSHEGDDSPWASLDEIADGYKESKTAPPPLSNKPAAPSITHEPSTTWESAAAMAAEAFAASRLAAMQQESSQPTVKRPKPVIQQSSVVTPRLTHLREDDNSRAAMVDVSGKSTSKRTATASCRVYIPDHVLSLLLDADVDSRQQSAWGGSIHRKGPVLHTAQLAGIMAAKRTSELIPLCHGLHLSHVDVKLEVIRGHAIEPEQAATHEKRFGGFAPEQLQDWDHSKIEAPMAGEDEGHYISVECVATTNSPTGVEMEALTGASVASLTLWDMLKSAGGREMRIDGMMVTRKTGGKSGDFERTDARK